MTRDSPRSGALEGFLAAGRGVVMVADDQGTSGVQRFKIAPGARFKAPNLYGVALGAPLSQVGCRWLQALHASFRKRVCMRRYG